MNPITEHKANAVLSNEVVSQKLYVALYDANKTEVSDTAYARQEVFFTEATEGAVTNSADVTYPMATMKWGNVTYIGLYDAPTDGNLLFFTKVQIPQGVHEGNTYKIPKGYMMIRFPDVMKP